MQNSFKPFTLPEDKFGTKNSDGFTPASATLMQKYDAENTQPTEAPAPTLKQRLSSITEQQNKEIQDAADRYKSGQQNIFSTLFQTLGSSVKAAGKSFALPVNVGLEKAFNVTGDLITAGRQAQKEADDEAIRTGKLVRGRDYIISDQPKIEEIIGSGLKKGIQFGQPLIDKYHALSPEAKANLGATSDLGLGTLDLLTGGVGAKAGAKFLEKSGSKVFDVATGKFVTNKIEDTAGVLERATNKVIEPFQSKTPEEMVGKILQGKTDDIPLGKIALDNIDTNNIKTFGDLHSKIDEAIPKFAHTVDEELAKDATRYKPDQLMVTKSAKDIQADPLLSKIAKISGTNASDIKVDYVTQSLKDLSELYTKTNDPVSKKVMDDALLRFQNEGLTRQEVNDLARIYGSEFSNKAFSKIGEPLTSVNAQALENTRMGLKTVARAGLGGVEAKSADAVLEAFYNTQRLVQKNIEAVNKARQKFTDRSLVQMVGRVAAKTINALTGGSLQAFVGGFLPRGVGNLEATWVDLEEALKYNLKLFRRASEAKNAEETASILKSGLDPTNPEIKTLIQGGAGQEVRASKRLVSDETYNKAVKNFKDNIGRMNSGIPVDQIKDLTVIAAYHIENGVKSAVELGSKLAEQGYQLTKAQLQKIYSAAQNYSKLKVKGASLPQNDIDSLSFFRDQFQDGKFSSKQVKNDLVNFLKEKDLDIKSKKDADLVDHIDEMITNRSTLREGVKPSVEMTPLHEEAKKYDRAKDFINSFDVMYKDSWRGEKSPEADRLLSLFGGQQFHGTRASEAIMESGFKKGNNYNSGAYFAQTPDEAFGYMRQPRGSGKDPQILVTDLSNLKIKKSTHPEAVRQINKQNEGFREDYVAKLKKQGFDGVSDSWETLVWNVNKIKKPKTLDQIWEETKNMINSKTEK